MAASSFGVGGLRLVGPALAVFVLASAGCSKSAPPEPAKVEPAKTAASPSAQFPGQVAKAGRIAWTDPPDWKRFPPINAMRVAQYKITAAPGDHEDAECAVTTFGADQGGPVEGNIERWIDQFDPASRSASPPSR
jgi:hypothetical protein